MTRRSKILTGFAGLAGAATIALPLTLSSSGGSVDVFVGSTPTPAASGFPDATNTGVPAGTSLTAYAGANPITTNNTTITGKLIVGNLEVDASGVTIQNSRITGAGGNIVTCIDNDTCGRGASPLTIIDSEIDCTNNGAVGVAGPGTAVGEANVTLTRVDIQGCENGLDMNDDWLVEDSYIHDLFEDPTSGGGDGTHTDGAQFASGHYEGAAGSVTAGAKDITFTHNTILGYGTRSNGSSPSFGTSAIITNRGPTNIDNNILIQNNLLTGGTTIYCEQDGYTATNERVINNHFTTVYGQFDGHGGTGFPFLSTDCSDESDISGNVIHETGAPVTLP